MCACGAIYEARLAWAYFRWSSDIFDSIWAHAPKLDLELNSISGTLEAVPREPPPESFSQSVEMLSSLRFRKGKEGTGVGEAFSAMTALTRVQIPGGYSAHAFPIPTMPFNKMRVDEAM